MEGKSPIKRFALPLALLVFFLITFSIARSSSAVADEVGGHTTSGYLYWQSGVFSGGINNFPLGQLLVSLPVVLFGETYELFSEQHLLLFRLPGVVCGVLTVLLVYLLGKKIFDEKTALIGAVLTAFSPNLAAHFSVACLDWPLLFFSLLTVTALYYFVETPSAEGAAIVGVTLGCALATKIQAILLLPLLLSILIVSAYREKSENRAFPFSILSLLLMALLPFLVINLVYYHLPSSSSTLLPPLFIKALMGKLKHGLTHAQPGYVLGSYSTTGWWWYFPLTVFVKTPLPTLFLFCLGLWRLRKEKEILFLVFPILLFLGGAMTASVNIGIRHILVIYPFLLLIAARGAREAQRLSGQPYILLPISIWFLFIALVVSPYQLSFFNLLAGGPARGYRILIDSNYDWGQNDHYLRKYLATLPEEQKVQINPDPFERTTGHIIVNTNALHGIYGNGGLAAYSWLRPIRPHKRVAYTWFVYDIPEGYFHDHPQLKAKKEWIPNRFRSWPLKLHKSERIRAWSTLRPYLLEIRHHYKDLKDDTYQYGLAWCLISVGAYGDALEIIREMLQRHPGSEELIGVGGEIMVRWKLGVLSFSSSQYVQGPEVTPRPNIDLDLIAAAKAGGSLEMTDLLFNTHLALARALAAKGRMHESKVFRRGAAYMAAKGDIR